MTERKAAALWDSQIVKGAWLIRCASLTRVSRRATRSCSWSK